jgi:hypothetical protein
MNSAVPARDRGYRRSAPCGHPDSRHLSGACGLVGGATNPQNTTKKPQSSPAKEPRGESDPPLAVTPKVIEQVKTCLGLLEKFVGEGLEGIRRGSEKRNESPLPR